MSSTAHAVAASPAARRAALTALALACRPGWSGSRVFFAYPLVATVYFSFYRYNLFTLQSIGLDNYRYFFHDDRAPGPRSRTRCGWWSSWSPPGCCSAWASRSCSPGIKAGAGFFRTVFYLPSLVPPVAGTVAFVFLLNPAPGPVNRLLGMLGIAGPTGSATRTGPSRG